MNMPHLLGTPSQGVVVESKLAHTLSSINDAILGISQPEVDHIPQLDLAKAAIIITRNDLEDAWKIVNLADPRRLSKKHRLCRSILMIARERIRTASLRDRPMQLATEKDVVPFIVDMIELVSNMHIVLAESSTPGERQRAHRRYKRGELQH